MPTYDGIIRALMMASVRFCGTELITIVLCASTFVNVEGQQRARLKDLPSCPDCRLSLNTVTIDEGAAQRPFGGMTSVSADRYGNIFLVLNDEPHAVLVFDSTARLIHTFGRQGDGPGEFGYALPPIRTTDDSLHVIDVLRRRWSVFDESYRYVRTSEIGFLPHDAHPLPDGRFLFNADILTPERAGYPLHTTDRRAQLETSFGGATVAFRSDLPFENRRRLAVAPDGRIWAARANQYLLEVWSDDLRADPAVYQLDADWFPHWQRPVSGFESDPPYPVIVELWAEDDRLWVVIHVPDEAWRPGERARGQEQALDPLRLHDVWDTRIDVLDIGAGEIVASSRFDAYMIPTFAGRVLVEYAEDEDLNPYVRVHRPTLARTPTTSGGV